MRVNYPSNESVIDNAGSTGVDLNFTSPLITAGVPVEIKDLSNKSYVETKFNSLDAGHLVTGVLPTSTSPEFIGDTINTAGSTAFTLTPSGVAAGSYVKVTVDSKGRTVGSGALAVSDIPNLPWSKVVRNKPITLAGYGITDGVKTNGDTVTGGVISSAVPNEVSHAATKAYADSMVGEGGVVNTGAVVSAPVETLAGGFLRANGGEVSKTSYASLYSVLMSDLTSTINLGYTSYGAMGAGQPWRQQYDFKVSDNSDITGWVTGTSLPVILAESQAIVTKNRVYLLGGYSSGYVNTVYTAPINTDGTLGTWVSTTALPHSLRASQAVVIKNKIYLIGGDSSPSTAPTVIYTPINIDGSLGTWETGTALPNKVQKSSTIVTKNRVYLIGGYVDGVINKKVYSSVISTDGTLGAWVTEADLPGNLASTQAIVTKNRIYLLGGYTGTSTNLVYTTTINTDGTLGTWTTGTNLPNILNNSQAIVTKNRVYLLGGYISSTVTTVYTAPINTDGTLGTWIAGTLLPGSLQLSQAIVTKNRVYLLGGHIGTGYSSIVYTAPLPGNEPLSDYSKFYDGSINKFDGSDLSGNIVVQQGDAPYDVSLQQGAGKPWKQQYEINTSQNTDITGWTQGTNLPGTLYRSQAIVTKNRVYLLGGYNDAGYLSTVYTAAINEDGTLGTWATGTPLPDALSLSQAIVTKNRVYLLGGGNNIASYTTTVYTAPINEDGTLGTWVTLNNLPGGLSFSQAIVTKNRVYLLGGVNVSGQYMITTYTAPINKDGTIGTWTTGANLLEGIGRSQAIVTKNRVYLLGGVIGNSVHTAKTYTAPINEDGTLGTWTTGANLPKILIHSQAIVTRDKVFLIGGQTSSNVYMSPIQQDGTLGDWVTCTSLPREMTESQVIITKNKIHILAIRSENSILNLTYTTSFSGGLNDYSPYYDGTITPTDPNNFKLPDYSKLETTTEKYYIKY